MTDYEYLSTSLSFDSNGVIFKTNGKITLFDGFMKVSNAKENENIKAIYLQASMLGTSYASLQEIRNALLDFKESGKFIISIPPTAIW